MFVFLSIHTKLFQGAGFHYDWDIWCSAVNGYILMARIQSISPHLGGFHYLYHILCNYVDATTHSVQEFQAVTAYLRTWWTSGSWYICILEKRKNSQIYLLRGTYFHD